MIEASKTSERKFVHHLINLANQLTTQLTFLTLCSGGLALPHHRWWGPGVRLHKNPWSLFPH